MEARERERKIDVSKLTSQEVDNLIVQIGAKMRGICDETATKVNAILNIYGMSAKIAIAFDELPKEMQGILGTPPKKRGRSKKDNLKKEPIR